MTTEYIEKRIAELERQIISLKVELENAKILDFYRTVNDKCAKADDFEDEFYATKWTISFGEHSIELPNLACIFNGITSTLEEFMDDEDIEYA